MENKIMTGDSQLISHMTLRKLLGFLGFLLPFILVFGAYFLDELQTIQDSISHYYYTEMRDVFVAIVSSFGLFLFSYKGEAEKDSILANIAGSFAICVALFPTNRDGHCEALHCYIHFISATGFFAVLAYISYFIFTLSNKPPELQTAQKRKRNAVYKICGIVITVCILLLALYFVVFNQSSVLPRYTVFIFESIALFAFGISWLTKGEAILGDK
jgi:hypothetical protein